MYTTRLITKFFPSHITKLQVIFILINFTHFNSGDYYYSGDKNNQHEIVQNSHSFTLRDALLQNKNK